jgi:hypothetical protein
VKRGSSEWNSRSGIVTLEEHRNSEWNSKGGIVPLVEVWKQPKELKQRNSDVGRGTEAVKGTHELCQNRIKKPN